MEMSSELTKEGASILAYLAQEGVSFLKETKTFVVEQAPDFIQQILKWKFAEGCCYVVLGVGMVAAGVLTIKYCRYNVGGDHDF